MIYVGNHFDETFILQNFTVQQIGGTGIYWWDEPQSCVCLIITVGWKLAVAWPFHGTLGQRFYVRSAIGMHVSVNGNTLYPTEGTGDCSHDCECRFGR
jgi:hypothetical protein